MQDGECSITAVELVLSTEDYALDRRILVTKDSVNVKRVENASI